LNGVESEIYSAFNNLVINAIRYTPDKGEVTIKWFEDDEGKHFCVSDSGIGIVEKNIPRLTERFYRVDVGRSRDSGGTGLGLAIVKHVLNRHNANLAITSEVNKGSVFCCLFPVE
jgi:two-component system phosphate regulon sensor histidine kinase PhoR